MRRDPSLTYQGALKILGQYDRSRLDRLNGLLGGVILGTGVAAATGTPLGGLAAIWGWVDQKNEATSLVRRILDAASDRLNDTTGHERHRLVAAAHTTLVGAAFFEALEEHLGRDALRRLAVTEAERHALTLGDRRHVREDLITDLYEGSVPVPSPTCGFEENVEHVRLWMGRIRRRSQEFFGGLTAWETVNRPLTDAFVEAAVERYRSHYLRMAATVPEFLVWASLGEHAATRSGVRDLRDDIEAAFTGQNAALSRLESLLRLMAAPREERDLCGVLHRANRGALDEHIVSRDAMRASPELTFPTLREAFINPRYRLGAEGVDTRAADESWWRERPVDDDIDLLLAAHLTAPDATRRPLLLLGHPGAGKSLLTKMLAARLPSSGYTVVRVPLRRVDAEAPVYEQIQQALDQATHRRINWWELADQSAPTIRVVLLDGLDELIQAAGDRGSYLLDVLDFQRREAEQDRPVVVIVTSRTVVADRVRIPGGTPVVKLEDFDEEQTNAWIRIWNRANAAAIESGRVRALTPETASAQPELARQPLLLLMLALYCADASVPALESDVSNAVLYRRLLETFTRREVAKTLAGKRPDVVEEAVRDQLWWLAIAAFAMFNRGRQDVTDAELGADLAVLDDGFSGWDRLDELGQRIIGQFFFVHTSEARTHGADSRRRSYEFMHATFGEYLLAAQLVETLAEIADVAFAGRRGPRDPNDDLLYALLSHQPLSDRATVLVFAGQLFQEQSEDTRRRILHTLGILAAGYRQRRDSGRYAAYRPLPVDDVRQLAAYSANLVLLHVFLSSDRVPLDRLLGGVDDPGALWRSTVSLWHAGLGRSHSLLRVLRHENGLVGVKAGAGRQKPEFDHARLMADRDLQSRLLPGVAIYDGYVSVNAGRWEEVMLSSLLRLVAPDEDGRRGSVLLLFRPPEGTPRRVRERVLDLLAMVVKLRAGELTRGSAIKVARWALANCAPGDFDGHAFAALVKAHPALLDEVPELRDPAHYWNAHGAALMLRSAIAGSGAAAAARLARLCDDIESVQRGRWTDDADKFDHMFRGVLSAHQLSWQREVHVAIVDDEDGASGGE
ncbi:AAA family ATPase [Actinomadura sp. NPDC047616]|uniref:NACHT domain-containing protein n=1 Tax=Actinomadura sp. NPDC047616 TaxID=3155914 RepID=UPI0033EE96A3